MELTFIYVIVYHICSEHIYGGEFYGVWIWLREPPQGRSLQVFWIWTPWRKKGTRLCKRVRCLWQEISPRSSGYSRDETGKTSVAQKLSELQARTDQAKDSGSRKETGEPGTSVKRRVKTCRGKMEPGSKLWAR